MAWEAVVLEHMLLKKQQGLCARQTHIFEAGELLEHAVQHIGQVAAACMYVCMYVCVCVGVCICMCLPNPNILT